MYDLINETLFDLEKSQEYILSIQVCLDGFSFSVVSPKDNNLVAFKKTPLEISDEKLIAQQLEEWIETNTIFQNLFKSVRVIVFQHKFTLVPEKLISEEIKSTIPPLLFSPQYEGFRTWENRIESSGTKLLFAIPQNLEAFLNKKFEKYKLIHPVSIIGKQLKEIEQKHRLVLMFNSNRMYTILYNNINIELANSFKIYHANDVIYYTLAVSKQLNISPKSTEVFYTGEIIGGKDTLSRLETHFALVDPFTAANPTVFDSEEFDQTIHQNLSLFI
jgi:hypothetical protein